MENDNLDQERRKQARLEKLGTDSPRCGTCGRTGWRVMELHHIAGQHHDETTVILCANCHREVTDDQKDHPAFDPNADPLLARIGHFLLGLADLLGLVVGKLAEFGHELIALAAQKPTGEVER
jgi:hypothetical protein